MIERYTGDPLGARKLMRVMLWLVLAAMLLGAQSSPVGAKGRPHPPLLDPLYRYFWCSDERWVGEYHLSNLAVCPKCTTSREQCFACAQGRTSIPIGAGGYYDEQYACEMASDESFGMPVQR